MSYLYALNIIVDFKRENSFPLVTNFYLRFLFADPCDFNLLTGEVHNVCTFMLAS